MNSLYSVFSAVFVADTDLLLAISLPLSSSVFLFIFLLPLLMLQSWRKKNKSC